MKYALLLLLAAFAPLHAQRPLALADLVRDAARHDKQLVEVEAFVSHGFEDFTLFDPSSEDRVWVEYGGRTGSDTLYCCEVEAERTREAPLIVEDIETRLVDDASFREFDRILQSTPEAIVHARLRGRFFAGDEAEFPGGRRRVGYGHFGFYSLFVIEQVVSITNADVADVDHDSSIALPPELDPSCIPSSSRPDFDAAIAAQRLAESGRRTWSFTDPARVAVTQLTELHRRPARIVRTVSRSRGRVVYEVAITGKPGTYWATVSRPHWLTLFAAKRHRPIWTLLGIAETECATAPASTPIDQQK